MAYEIIGETIKSATSLKLGQIFDNPKRYKENITNPVYPSFWIIQVNQSISSAGLQYSKVTNQKQGRIRIDYIINIQYRIAQNTESISNLQQQLDEIGLKLLSEFNELDLELPTKITNKSYEKVDGVGQFMFNIAVFANAEEDNLIKMQELERLEEIIIKEE